jgi:hypothetical protein
VDVDVGHDRGERQQVGRNEWARQNELPTGCRWEYLCPLAMIGVFMSTGQSALRVKEKKQEHEKEMMYG